MKLGLGVVVENSRNDPKAPNLDDGKHRIADNDNPGVLWCSATDRFRGPGKMR